MENYAKIISILKSKDGANFELHWSEACGYYGHVSVFGEEHLNFVTKDYQDAGTCLDVVLALINNWD